MRFLLRSDGMGMGRIGGARNMEIRGRRFQNNLTMRGKGVGRRNNGRE